MYGCVSTCVHVLDVPLAALCLVSVQVFIGVLSTDSGRGANAVDAAGVGSSGCR